MVISGLFKATRKRLRIKKDRQEDDRKEGENYTRAPIQIPVEHTLLIIMISHNLMDDQVTKYIRHVEKG